MRRLILALRLHADPVLGYGWLRAWRLAGWKLKGGEA